MSHISQIEFVVRDLDALKKACEAIGLTFKENQKTYKWYGQWVGAGRPEGMDPSKDGKCDHAIGVPGKPEAYEVGVIANTNGRTGTYSLVADFWQGGFGLMEKVGKNCMKLNQAYIGQVSRKKMMGMGFQVTQKVLTDGTIEMTARR